MPWLWIGGGAAVVVLAVVLILVFSSGSGGGVGTPNPLMYMEDGDAFLAVGAECIELEDAAMAYGYLDAMVSANKDVLYYLADVGKSGEGDLMRIRLWDANAEPEVIAEDVYSARISTDGKKVLYLTDMEDGVGELNICSSGGEPTSIGDSVADWTFGFSANGGYVCFVINDDGEETLMLYKGGSEAEELYSADKGEYINSFYADDSGRVVFGTQSDSSENTLYLYKNGDAERVSKDAYFVAPFGNAEEFLYSTSDGELIYYSKGEEDTVTDEYSGYPRFPQGEYLDANRFGKHFLYSEAKSGDSSVVTMYEINLPGEGVKIGKVDGGYVPDADLRHIAYVYDGTLYLAQKSGGEWDETEVCDNAFNYDFDQSGSYLYYIEGDENSYSGDLYRMSVSTGKAEKLMKDATQFLLCDGKCYAINDDEELYLVNGEKDSEQLEDGVTGLYATEGGIYAIEGDDIYFLSGGNSERVARGVTIVSDYGLIVAADSY